MKQQLLVPIHTYPDGTSQKLLRHIVAVARHVDAEVHALALIANFPKVSSPLGNMLLDVPAMIGKAEAECRVRAAALIKGLEAQLKPLGLSFRSTDVECFPTMFGETAANHARYHDLVLAGIADGRSAFRTAAEAAIFGSGRPPWWCGMMRSTSPSIMS